ncbi:hypothetical protein GC209_02355 [bacterium]|nr:hypothetical protein [bacterium]
MISALSGSSNAAALLSMFSRQNNPAPQTEPARTANAPPVSRVLPPPGSGNGTSAQSIVAALLDALSGGAQSAGQTAASGAVTDGDGDSDGSAAATTGATGTSATGSLSDLLTKLVSAIDTNGDGQISADELQSAAQKLQSAGGNASTTATHHHHGGHRPDNDGDDGPSAAASSSAGGAQAASGAGDAAKSLYDALVNAVANEAPGATSVSIGSDVAQKFLSAIKVAA